MICNSLMRIIIQPICQIARRIFVHLHEDTVASHGHRGPRQCRRENAVSRSGAPCPARPLNRMRRIKDRAVSGLANPVERSHIGHEVVISERSAAFRETEFWIAEGDKLVGNISNIPWRQKLAFFHIKRATRLGGSAQKVGLPAQKCWDLQHIDLFSGNVGLYWQMNIRCYRNSQVAADGRKNLAALAYANSTKRAH